MTSPSSLLRTHIYETGLRDKRIEAAHGVPHLDPFLLQKDSRVSTLLPLFFVHSRTQMKERQLQSCRAHRREDSSRSINRVNANLIGIPNFGCIYIPTIIPVPVHQSPASLSIRGFAQLTEYTITHTDITRKDVMREHVSCLSLPASGSVVSQNCLLLPRCDFDIHPMTL